MYRKTLKTLVIASVAAMSLTAAAMPLEEYNLVLAQDYNFSGGDVEGKTFIGGNLNAAGRAADFATKEPQLTVSDTLKVVGDITATNINMQHGNVVYGGNNNVGHINFNGPGELIHDNTLSIDAVFAELVDYSTFYASLSSNGSFVAENSSLSYYDTAPLAVFNVSASDVFAQNTGLKLDYNAADTVVINVSGANISVAGGVNLLDGFRPNELGAQNILWNFYEAETIDFRDIAMFGSVLAPTADLIGGAVFDGSVGAKSYTGGREFHRFLFNPPSVDVTEPSSIALLMMGLGALIAVRKRKIA